MDEQDIIERLNLLEFKQQLLFDNTDISRLLFESNITNEQYRSIMDLFDSYRSKIGKGESISHHTYENELSRIIDKHDYHFAEFLAQSFHKDDRWEEVFEHLYGQMPKFQSYINK
jgi:hypothetical protein